LDWGEATITTGYGGDADHFCSMAAFGQGRLFPRCWQPSRPPGDPSAGDVHLLQQCAGRSVREALVARRRRGVYVQVLLDAVGSFGLSASFLETPDGGGGKFRWFQSAEDRSHFLRDHRKLLVCDEKPHSSAALTSPPEYDGDGVTTAGATRRGSPMGRWRPNWRRASMLFPSLSPVSSTSRYSAFARRPRGPNLSENWRSPERNRA